MTYQTQDLIQILDQELRAHWRGQRVLLSSRERLNDPVMAMVLGPEKLSKVFAYRDFRDQVHTYQREHQVSGIISRTCHHQGQWLEFPELHHQLVAIPGDKEQLMAAKAHVLAFWHRVTVGQSLWLTGPEPLPISRDWAEAQIDKAEWLEVDPTPQEVYLGLCWGDPEICHNHWARPTSGCDRLMASSSEPSRIKVY